MLDRPSSYYDEVPYREIRDENENRRLNEEVKQRNEETKDDGREISYSAYYNTVEMQHEDDDK